MAPKQASGWQKRQKRERVDELVKSQAGAMQKFLAPNPPTVNVENQQEDFEVELEVEQEQEQEQEQQQERVEVEDEEERVEVEDVAKQQENVEKQQERVDIFDPRRWEGLNAHELKVLVAKGPKRDTSIEFGPLNQYNRRFSATIYTRTLSNLEKCDREWLVYSKELDKMFCFCCKVFRTGAPKGNGNFLGIIEMLEKFDPVIKEHVRQIISGDLHVHYLGRNIQNEIILLLADEIKKELIKNIKEAKYYLIILDCTPDSSHQEQMTIIVRYVKISSNSVIVEESFLGFLNANDTTGKGLFEVTCAELKSLGLEIGDMRGQGYDNGANMKGSRQGVQTRFLKENPKAFYTPCGSHSLNLILCDMANSCVKGKRFFGHIQRIYTIFGNSANRWQILKDNVKGWSLKPLSQTRWESRFESVKAIKLQLADLREALLQVGETDNDAAIADEAISLAERELSEFDFLLSIVIWYEVLNQVNLVSKKLEAKDMHLEIAIQEINNLIKYFKEYRENGFSKAIDEAREIASEMDIDPIFIQKRIIKRKKRNDESSSSEEVAFTVEENFRLRNIKDEDLKSSCYRLEDALKFEGSSDIDAEALYMELNLFRASLTNKFSDPVDVLEHMKEDDYFPEACIAYRILLTIPVTMASAERSFSKLKLLKSYLRSTMSQDRLSGLAMIAIKNEVLDNINCEELIQQFAMKNARRAARIIG
ncbi:zinc finger MYM-type protein 1-like [Helianthus annuus]|uniref:zinc finger MYM-type protein 1-like n=1 Tax=Helianthus annuus TaxID=4232 RepID=UPI000B8FEA2B|nr:zinc finger MYM-type protein 1-like [Helianthus annuus]